jgi:hypothetical protein
MKQQLACDDNIIVQNGLEVKNSAGTVYLNNGSFIKISDPSGRTTNISQYIGDLYFGNYSETGGRGFFWGMHDSNAVFDWRMRLIAECLQILRGAALRVYNSTNQYYHELSQDTFSMVITNWANYNVPNGTQSIIFRTANTSGGVITNNLVIQPGGVTAVQDFSVNKNLYCDGTLTCKNNVEIKNDAILYFYDSTNTYKTWISQFGRKIEISNEAYDAGSSDQCFQFFLRVSNATTPVERFVIARDTTSVRNNLLCEENTTFNKNITLQTTHTDRGVNDLGYIKTGAQYSWTSLAPNTTNTASNIALTTGVWNIIFQFTCKTPSQVYGQLACSISSTTAFNDNSSIIHWITFPGDSHVRVQVTSVVTVTATQTIYGVVASTTTLLWGSLERSNTSMTAVRIG